MDYKKDIFNSIEWAGYNAFIVISIVLYNFYLPFHALITININYGIILSLVNAFVTLCYFDYSSKKEKMMIKYGRK